jgi:hypothetical protein
MDTASQTHAMRCSSISWICEGTGLQLIITSGQLGFGSSLKPEEEEATTEKGKGSSNQKEQQQRVHERSKCSTCMRKSSGSEKAYIDRYCTAVSVRNISTSVRHQQ